MSDTSNEIFVEPDFKMLFEQAPGLYLVLDPNLHIVAASDAWLRASGARREEIIGRYVFDALPDNPDDPSADSVRNSLASFKRVLRTGETDVMELQRHDVRRPESEGGGFEELYWSPVNSPILNPDGSVAYIFQEVEHVTEFVRLQQQGVEQDKLTDALRERTLRMEADIYARSREAAETSMQLKRANEELARLNEKARELDELKSRFFANVSHELRTPLTLILGPVKKTLAAQNITDEQRRDMIIVERNARALLRNVNDLLDLSKLDAGGARAEYAEVDLARLARFAASHFETVADEKNIGFAVQTPESLFGQVDPEKVQRVLFNLLSNALKFTPEGGSVRFSLRGEGGRAIFVVEDTGPGIPEDMRQAIFDRFRQVDSSATRQYGGTGLGLAIVREFVNLHNGAVEVTETPGGGSRFTVEIPLFAPAGSEVKASDLDLDEESAQGTIAELRTQVGVPTHHEGPIAPDAPLVLVVEDNPEMNAFVAESLGDRYRTATASDGVEGLEKALRLRPDMIVSDIMMPRMSGDEMVREIRRHPEMDDVPILLLTAKADENLRVELLRGGVQDYLVKPFVADELVARSAGLIERKKKTEASLRESYALLRAVTEGVTDAIFVKDSAGRYLMINKAGAEKLGTSVENALGHNDRELLGQDAAARLIEDDRKIMAEGMTLTFEETLVSDGARRIYLTNKGPYRDHQGQVIGVLGISVDITERKLAEQREKELEKSQLDFYRRTILAATNGKLWITDKEYIDDIIGEPTAEWELLDTADLSAIRQDVLSIARSEGLEEDGVNRLLTCIGESTANALKHTGKGIASVHRRDGAFIFVVSDTGTGIHELSLPDVALVMGYSTVGTGGMGYKLMMSSADRVYLATSKEGTTVATEFAIEKANPSSVADSSG